MHDTTRLTLTVWNVSVDIEEPKNLQNFAALPVINVKNISNASSKKAVTIINVELTLSLIDCAVSVGELGKCNL